MSSIGYGIEGAPETRMIAYPPASDSDAAKIEQLRTDGGVSYS
jgi:hypothetical protein